ncbi:unnamed protein product (macronuclear) [Paramecium tetraurelia]|uniref:RBR-type E3 ubiquitin transferase n=1 Tax=Paramecium tetraurelia TaxID=5888 RepID=A0E6L7_PARTE|nr:uncharacterized protein GSPATT00003799001 [Paramecium tetraurelia]CAK90934.1 unnamed protein product [Paramecium tetraurelia]|eukprot:XP_001458331.1 hypothetical protein (macronuclear) [Paramecium tetraurelia strain d4-2]
MDDYLDEEQYLGLEDEYDNSIYNNVTLLSANDLYQEFKDRLEIIKDKIGETSQVVLNILIFFNFEVKTIYEKLLLNDEFEQIKVQLEEQGIYKESKVNINDNLICSICEQTNAQGFSLNCNHKFCKSCWNQMIEIQFSSQIPLVRCLQDQCFERLPHQFLEQYPKYKQILIKRFMQHDDQITWCPGLNCENVFKCLNFSNSIKCPCGIKFCSKCRNEKHHPIPCDILKKVLEYQQSNDYWAILHASKCPQCGRLIQRTEGCFHLKCLCGQHFCFKCSGPWAKDHEQSFYTCPYMNTNKNPSKYALQLKDELQSINNNIRNIEQSVKTLKQQVKKVLLDDLLEYSEKAIQLFKTSKSFLFYKFHLMENKDVQMCEQTFQCFQEELNSCLIIIQKKVLEVQDNESLKERTMLEYINFEDSEKKVLRNLKIKKQLIKQYIIETLIK